MSADCFGPSQLRPALIARPLVVPGMASDSLPGSVGADLLSQSWRRLIGVCRFRTKWRSQVPPEYPQQPAERDSRPNRPTKRSALGGKGGTTTWCWRSRALRGAAENSPMGVLGCW
jgi:hypothetical protein